MYATRRLAGLFVGLVLLGSEASGAAPIVGVDWSKHPENVWVLQSPRPGAPVPGFVYEGSGSYDPFHRRWIHHAGHDGIPQGFHTFTFDLDTGRWRQLFPPTSPPGVCCVDGSNVFDVANRRFVRFPGGSLGHGYQWSRGVRLKESAVWVYDLTTNTWTNMRPPPYREPGKGSSLVVGGLNAGAVYDPNHEIVLTFGGQGSGGGKNTLFAYDTHANALEHREASNRPPARDGMGLAYDAKHDRMVLFGSQYLADERTWLYDVGSNRWEAVTTNPHPPGKKVTKDYTTIPRMAYDSRNGVVLCLAWMGEKGHQTWVFDTGERRWTKMDPKVEPDGSKSRSRNLSFDHERNLFLLETSNAKTNRPEIWTYRYRKPPLDPRPAPPTALRVVTEAGGKVRLSWQASPSTGLRGYEVWRAQGEHPWQLRYQRLGTTTGTSLVDEGSKTGQVSFYRVHALGKDGLSSAPSNQARTQPRVLLQPVVSVLARDRVEVRWNRHPDEDVVGYDLYRGVVRVGTVRKGKPAAWRDNDPEYDEPRMVKVEDVTDLKKLNDRPLEQTTFTDRVNLGAKGPEAGDYRYAVHAYVVRAVNRLGIRSGPSPHAPTIPSEPLNVLCREQGEVAELKWSPAVETGVIGYHVYRLEGTWGITRVTEKPVKETRWRQKVGRGTTRFWVVAVDVLGQEGQPSSPAWFNRSYRGFYEGDWHQ